MQVFNTLPDRSGDITQYIFCDRCLNNLIKSGIRGNFDNLGTSMLTEDTQCEKCGRQKKVLTKVKKAGKDKE
jgi:methionyl-tRNA synthetase